MQTRYKGLKSLENREMDLIEQLKNTQRQHEDMVRKRHFEGKKSSHRISSTFDLDSIDPLSVEIEEMLNKNLGDRNL